MDALQEIKDYIRVVCPLSGSYDEPDIVKRIHDIVDAWFQEAISLGPAYNPYSDRFEGEYYRGKVDAFGKINSYVSPSGFNASDLPAGHRFVLEMRAWVVSTVVPAAPAEKKTFRLTTSEGPKYDSLPDTF